MHRIIRSRLGLLAGALILAASAARAGEEIALGAAAPEFDLEGTDGKRHSLSSLTAARDGHPAAQATVVVFTCNMCPYAKAYEPVLIDLAKKYADKPVAWVLVNPNDPTIVPGDSFEKMKERATEKSYPFPYVFDATQATARAYGASRTPHVFLLDGERIVRYRGRINDNQDPKQVTSHDLVDAIDALLAGKEVATAATKAFGCSIKWKKES
jgi:thiol-disulfide isomerase/thioredoxin